MRHGKKFNHLGRKAAHRKAMLSNMACSLIEHKRINTTVAKARELKKFVEPLITRSKEDTVHNRRVAFRYLQSRDIVSELFGAVAVKVGDRPGGYTRIIKTGTRLGDNADMAMIELVDFNEIYSNNTEKKATKKKSTRRAGKKTETAEAAAPVVEETPVVEEAPAKEEAAAKEEAPAAEAENKADDTTAEEEKKGE